jgi:hypothetical protein
MNSLLEKPISKQERMVTANLALAYFAPETTLALVRGAVQVRWRSVSRDHRRRWQTSGRQDFYPTWSNSWPHGGTCCTALSQLVRWIQGNPVLPLASWRFWCGPTMKLACHDDNDRGADLLAVLMAGGYPKRVPCVLCKTLIDTNLDWWNQVGLSGPYCSHNAGCRQHTPS